MTKTCTKCLEALPLSRFNKKEGGLSSRCKTCLGQWYRAYCASSAERRRQVIDQLRRYKRRQAAFVAALKEGKPCVDCGVSYPHYVMDYDHRPGTKKVMSLARMSHGSCSQKRLLEEVEKCDLVCANCHRIRTHSRRSQK